MTKISVAVVAVTTIRREALEREDHIAGRGFLEPFV